MSLALCGHAARRGHQVSLAFARRGDMVDAYATAGATCHHIPATPIAVRHPTTALRSVRTLRSLVRRNRIDVLFTSQVNYVSLLAIVERLSRVRTAVHLGLVYDYPSPVFRTGMRNIDLGVAPSEQTAEGWRNKDWPTTSLRVIANGVDTQVFHPADGRAAARSRVNLTHIEEPLVACVGRLVPDKGIFTLLRAFGRYRQTSGRGHLLFVGQPGAEEVSTLRELARQEGIDPAHWQVRPPTATPEDVYRAADLVVTPSEWDEPFGLAPLEALACGTMAVVSDRGRLPDFVAPIGTPAVFKSGDVNELQCRLSYWLADRERREQAAATLAAFARSEFSFEKCGDAYLDAFKSVVASRR